MFVFLTLILLFVAAFACYSIFILPFIVGSLRARIAKLEQQLGKQNIQSTKQVKISTPSILNTFAPVAEIEKPDPIATSEKKPQPMVPYEPRPNPIVEWVKKDFLIKLGGLFLLLGGMWFTSLLFVNDVIGPQGRVSLGLLAGCLILAFGYIQIEKRIQVGVTLIASGASIMIAALWSGVNQYKLYTPEIAFGGMILTILVVFAISIQKNLKSLAIFSSVSVYLIPFLTGSNSSDLNNLFTYFLIMTCGIFGVSYFKQWRILQLISIIAVSGFSTLFYVDSGIQVWVFISCFSGLFYLTSIFNVLKSKQISALDILNNLISTVVVNFWIVSFVDAEFRVAVLAISSVVTLSFAYLLQRSRAMVAFTLIQSVSSFITLVTALYLQFSDQPLLLALIFSILILGIQWLFEKTQTKPRLFAALPFLMFLPFFEYLRWETGSGFSLFLSNQSQLPQLIAIVSLAFLGLTLNLNSILFQYISKKKEDKHILQISSVLTGCSLLYGYITLIKVYQFLAVNEFLVMSQNQTVNLPIFTIFLFSLTSSLLIYYINLKDSILRIFGSFFAILSGFSLFVVIVEIPNPYQFWYLLLGFISSLYLIHYTKKESKISGIILYCITLVLVLTNTYNASTDELLKILTYLIYIPIFIVLFFVPRFSKEKRISLMHRIGFALFLLQLVFVELWSIGDVAKIIISVSIGVLFISTGFLRSKTKNNS